MSVVVNGTGEPSMISLRSVALLLPVLCFLPAALPQSPQPADPNKLVTIEGFDVKGTRLPKESIIRLSTLKVGQQVNYTILNAACHRITSTGLVKMINYAYDKFPGKPGVMLSLTLQDEMPLLPAKIAPSEDEDRIWHCLETADPIFTRELPNTENALSFYAANIERCLRNQGRTGESVAKNVACDGNGNSTQIVFNIRQHRQTALRQ